MTCKIVNITIPVTREIPEEINGFSPEENYIMLKIGSQCLLEGRKVVAGLTQKEIYEKTIGNPISVFYCNSNETCMCTEICFYR